MSAVSWRHFLCAVRCACRERCVVVALRELHRVSSGGFYVHAAKLLCAQRKDEDNMYEIYALRNVVLLLVYAFCWLLILLMVFGVCFLFVLVGGFDSSFRVVNLCM